MEQAMFQSQLRYIFNLKKEQLVKVLEKAAKLTSVLVNDSYTVFMVDHVFLVKVMTLINLETFVTSKNISV